MTAIETSEIRPARGWAVFSYGFRPFFLLAGLYAALAVPLWLLSYLGAWTAEGALPAARWHMHEMLFGFVAAAIAGFLLTAVPNWTGRAGYGGRTLVLLVLLVLVWLAGRAALNPWAGASAAAAAALDLAFFPALAAMIAPALWRSGNRRNLPFLLPLSALFAANLLGHLDQAGILDGLLADGWERGIRLGINAVLLMVTVIGGRIVPSFTSSALHRRGIDVDARPLPWLERATIGATVLVLAVDLALGDGAAGGAVAALACVLHALRLARWHGLRTLGEPILWVLHLGYAWVPIALALKAAWLLAGFGAAPAWQHALAIGAFATMILAVMTRAALGHTGRPLVAAPAIVLAYLLLTGAALLRVVGTWLPADLVPVTLVAAGVAWTGAFALFLLVYAPVLLRPRADGRPG